MNRKQMTHYGALGSAIFLGALVTVLLLTQATIAAPTVTVYKSPT